MYVIGITGGIGSGKSRILRHMSEKWGAAAVALDDVGRRLMEKGGATYEGILELFGDDRASALLADGSIDKGAVAAAMVGDPGFEERLNAVVHPAVRRETLRIIKEEESKGTELLCLESAILFETGYDALCGEVWYIYARTSERSKRLKENRGYSDERIEGTMNLQLTDEEYRKKDIYVIDNSGKLEDAFAAADRRAAEIRGCMR